MGTDLLAVPRAMVANVTRCPGDPEVALPGPLRRNRVRFLPFVVPVRCSTFCFTLWCRRRATTPGACPVRSPPECIARWMHWVARSVGLPSRW